MVLRRWGSSVQKFGFINGVDNVNWPPYRDSINSVDKTKFLYKRKTLKSMDDTYGMVLV